MFHDGSELTQGDVIFSINRILDKATAATNAGKLADVAAVASVTVTLSPSAVVYVVVPMKVLLPTTPARAGGLVPPTAPAAVTAGAAPPQGPTPQDALKAWRTSVSMDVFKKLRTMYNDAGVTIYAWKQLTPNMSDEEFEYVFNVAEALGCTHTTLELPTDAAQLKRIGAFAEKRKIYAAYHTHLQGSMTAFDQAFAASNANMANIDLGHFVAATGESPVPFLRKFHDRIASVHLKDRQTPAHGAGNLPWGTGDTPLKEILQTVKKNRWTMPATIELEYEVPKDSDAVKEVAKCLDYCRKALA
jgi:sugar phosphate isomerase/epimerase